mgnify:CR=1 FL=1
MKKITLFGSVFTALALGFAVMVQAATSVPTVTFPVNGAILTVAQFVKVDWTDSTGGTAPYEYQYESYSDAAYTANLSTSGWLSASEISTVGSAEGDYYVRVRARDATLATTDWSNGAGSVHKITVDNTPTNVAPVLGVITTPVTIPELSLHSFTAVATDMNFGDTLAFSMVGAPSGATLDSSTGVFNWTPSEAQGPGDYVFEVRVSDGSLGDEQFVMIHVTEVANAAPVLGAITTPVTIPELSPFSFDADATDADGDTLSFSLSGYPAGSSINSSTGVFSWTPSEAQGPGSYTFDVIVSDGSLSDGQSVTINVTEVADPNVAPVLDPITSSVTIPELSPFTFDANATDANGDTLTFSMVGAPSGATLDSSTGVFNWTPSEAQGPGSYTFDVIVSDGSLSDSQFVTIHVTEESEPVPTTPENKDDCKKGGWRTFTNPSFRNQGQCVSFVNHSNWHFRHDD